MAIEDAVTTQHTEWVSARELSRRISELLDHVAAGAAVMICRHGRPVAALSPLLPGAPSVGPWRDRRIKLRIRRLH